MTSRTSGGLPGAPADGGVGFSVSAAARELWRRVLQVLRYGSTVCARFRSLGAQLPEIAAGLVSFVRVVRNEDNRESPPPPTAARRLLPQVRTLSPYRGRGAGALARRPAKRVRWIPPTTMTQKRARVAESDRLHKRPRLCCAFIPSMHAQIDQAASVSIPATSRPYTDTLIRDPSHASHLGAPSIVDPPTDDIEELHICDESTETPPEEPIAMCTLLDDGSCAVLIVRCDGSVQTVLIPPPAPQW